MHHVNHAKLFSNVTIQKLVLCVRFSYCWGEYLLKHEIWFEGVREILLHVLFRI